jgi:hypothetical protein
MSKLDTATKSPECLVWGIFYAGVEQCPRTGLKAYQLKTCLVFYAINIFINVVKGL